MLAAWNGLPITYAGGIGSMEDLREFARISGEKLDYTIGVHWIFLAVRFRMPS